MGAEQFGCNFGLIFRKLFGDPTATSLGRRDHAVVFHRPGRRVSAIRQGNDKLMVFWKSDGTVARRELFDVGENPREEGRDTAAKQKSKTRTMEATLLAFLKSVDAETPGDIAPKKKKRNRSQKR